MPKLERLFCRQPAKRNRAEDADLGRDIMLALCIKFCLLLVLWWNFFAGEKVPVDAGSAARALLSAPANPLAENPDGD